MKCSIFALLNHIAGPADRCVVLLVPLAAKWEVFFFFSFQAQLERRQQCKLTDLTDELPLKLQPLESNFYFLPPPEQDDLCLPAAVVVCLFQ